MAPGRLAESIHRNDVKSDCSATGSREYIVDEKPCLIVILNEIFTQGHCLLKRQAGIWRLGGESQAACMFAWRLKSYDHVNFNFATRLQASLDIAMFRWLMK